MFNMVRSIIISQSLQNDFIKPIGRYDHLPNLLHVGFEEARRLVGAKPSEGSIALMMRWAYHQSADDLAIIHIRDWHDPNDNFQAKHLHQFGFHCIKNTEGAEFAFKVENPDRPVTIVNSNGLNDFIETDLNEQLNSLYKSHDNLKIGLIGVWTEAKIFFLAYELASRFPESQIAVCSALTASSSRAHHFLALEQLKRLLGVKIFSSIGEFAQFLFKSSFEVALPAPTHQDWPKITFESEKDIEINDTDKKLIGYLFRNCQEVSLRVLTGGFSGNIVLGSESVDLHGHQEVPHVVKIGPQGPIGQERTSFERIEGVLGNNAPRITEFADFKGRGALKYRYASMGGSFVNTFQKLYCSGLSPEKCENYLSMIFDDQLGRFYRAATSEHVNLLEHYGIVPDFAEGIRGFIEDVIGESAKGNTLRLPTGHKIPNPYIFYKEDLPEILPKAELACRFSFVHGDLNGANIIIDGHENIWLIDFFHTDRGHVLKDLIKLENDLLFIYTPVNNVKDLEKAIELTDLLIQVEDLGKPLPELSANALLHTGLRRAYDTICILRSFYPELVKEDRNINQLLIAQIRYAGHTLIFDESNQWQKLWALYSLSVCCDKLAKRLKKRGPLRVDWVKEQYTQPGRIGMTILPGRKDYSRSLQDDIRALKTQGVNYILTLITIDELEAYGVENIFEAYAEAKLNFYFFPIIDQGICSIKEMNTLIDWIDTCLAEGGNIMVHCVGGLGRSGLAVACYLISRGLDAEVAITEVRRVRTGRAIESKIQENFIRTYAYHNKASKYFEKIR